MTDLPPAAVPPAGGDEASRAWAVEVASASPLPVLLLEGDGERIVAASEPATSLLSAAGTRPVAGSTVASLTYRVHAPREQRSVDPVPGYRSTRSVHIDGQAHECQLWIRPVDPATADGLVVALIAELDGGETAAPAPSAAAAATAVVGSTDRRLVIDRVSDDAQSVFGRSSAALLGTCLLDVVMASDVSALLTTLAQANASATGATARFWLRCPDGNQTRVVMAVVPLLPTPCCAFAVLADEGLGTPRRGRDLDSSLRRLARTAGMVSSSGDGVSASGRVPGMSTLSSRELAVVRQLMSGDRVPAIARGLYLSQSTVRNYLSSVFRKLDVSSQQELLDLLRPRR